MGNCIDLLSYQSQEKVRILTLDGEKKFKSSITIKKIISGRYHGYKLVHHAHPYTPLPQDAKLEPGEAYYLIPDVAQQPCRPSDSPEKSKRGSCKTGKVKIVITRQQLELLLRNAKKFQSGKLAVRFSESFKEGHWKWHPSLAPITEVRNF